MCYSKGSQGIARYLCSKGIVTRCVAVIMFFLSGLVTFLQFGRIVVKADRLCAHIFMLQFSAHVLARPTYGTTMRRLWDGWSLR